MLIQSVSQSISALINYVYELLQRLVIYLFSPRAPPPSAHLQGPRIAIIGAGITGVSAAAHCVGHGCDVVIFEKRPRHNLGGIWSRVNSTSSLQVYSVMYRFHPSIVWHKGYPNRRRILEEVERLWKRYGLQSKTRFETPVESMYRDSNGTWLINLGSDSEEAFDGVIVATGTCGDPSMPSFPGRDSFQGQILHSSELDGLDVSGKKIAIVGGGASAIEAVEYAVQGEAKIINILARVRGSHITAPFCLLLKVD
jgi:cation diffusion facilitator CzcD-associated flavoprotein CzcO